MSNILSQVFNETDLAAITEMARIKRSRLGAGYDRYIKKVAETLKDIYPKVSKLSRYWLTKSLGRWNYHGNEGEPFKGAPRLPIWLMLPR